MGKKIAVSKGDKYGRLVIVKEIKALGTWSRRFRCKCSCGNITDVDLGRLVKGATKSCGCLAAEAASKRLSKQNTKHGFHGHPLYFVWQAMKRRCYDDTDEHYHNYGGRGIIVCSAWKNDAGKFIAWAIAHGWKRGLQLDRKKNDLNYTPTNCQFTTAKRNSNNKRDNIMVRIRGRRYTLMQAVEKFSSEPYDRVYARFRKLGWTIEESLGLKFRTTSRFAVIA